jgi:hypothetical protein
LKLEFLKFLAFRCAYCNYLNGARKHKPVFKSDFFSPTQPQNSTTNVERMEMSVIDSSDSTNPINESRVTRRSIRVPTTTNNGIHPRSLSLENKHQIHPALSSSEESLSDKK